MVKDVILNTNTSKIQSHLSKIRNLNEKNQVNPCTLNSILDDLNAISSDDVSAEVSIALLYLAVVSHFAAKFKLNIDFI